MSPFCKRVLIQCVFALILGFGLSGSARADLPSISLDSVLSNITGFLNSTMANATVRTLGTVFDHRPLEPATALGTSLGLDAGFEVDLVQLSPELSTALSNAGFNITLPQSLPSARLVNFHKGLSDSVDVGGSYLAYNGYTIWGADLKVVLYQPEEGLTWAIRLGYTSLSFPIGSTTLFGTTVSLKATAATWTPALLISKKLEFADPYLGIAYQYAVGTLEVSQSGDFTIPNLESIKGAGGGPIAFLGISLRVPVAALRLTLEGTYSPAGFNAIGSKLGLSF